MTYSLFGIDNLPLAQGGQLEEAKIAYLTRGSLNADKSNAVLLTTYYGGSVSSYDAIIGPGRGLDPDKWFIVVAGMLGGSESTSPSNWQGTGNFPIIDVRDNVAAQKLLLNELFGVRHLALAAGWSMGAMHSLAWASLHPAAVDRVVGWCGSARCWPMNRAFLEGMAGILAAGNADTRAATLRAFGRAYAGWAHSAAFFREELWRDFGFGSLEEFLRYWEEDHAQWDPRDLLAMIDCWRTADPGQWFAGQSWQQALARIKARTTIIACDRDQYFIDEELQHEAAAVAGARFQRLQSPFGHSAGAPGRVPEASAVIDAAIAEALAT